MSLRQQLRELFFKFHILTASEARAFLEKSGTSVSLVAIYAELKYFQSIKMLVKEKTRYILSIGWVLDAQLTLERVYYNLLHAPHFNQSLLMGSDNSKSSKQTWTFSSLQQMNEFWVQLIFSLGSSDLKQPILEYVPHLWFAFIEPERDSQFQRAFKSKKFDIRILVGGNTRLDHEPYRRTFEKPTYKCTFRTTKFSSLRNRCYCIIGDWLIKITFPTQLASQIDELFEKSDRREEIPYSKLWRLLNEKCKVSLVLEYKSNSWKKTRRIFQLEEICD